jgi:segregation and condensation protein B
MHRKTAFGGSSGRKSPLGGAANAWIRRESPARGFVRLWQFRDSASNAEIPPSERGPHWRDAKTARVEAILLLGREPLSSRKIAQLANLADGTEARTLIRRLKRLHDDSGSAFGLEEVAGGFRLFTRPQFSPWVRRLVRSTVENRLSAPAMETLAVVAYRQPILRAEIESIRGVQCDDILRQLLERDLLRIVGRAEDLGRPLLYGTTKRFLELFGLRNLEELPRAAEFRNPIEPRADEALNSTAQQSDSEPGNDRLTIEQTKDRTPEEESVTTRMRPTNREELEEAATLLAVADPLPGAYPIVAAEDEDDDLDDDDEDDDDDDDSDEEDEDDDFVDEEWEEVDDDEEEDDEDEDEEDDDEEWEDDDEDDDDWDDDEEEEEDDDEE